MQRLFLLFVFFASGFAALLYQTIWQRLLALFGGADVHSITIIVSAFMAGLGFGNLAGGYAADRLTPRGRIFLFAQCEAAVALFAVLSPWIYYDLLYVRVGEWHLPLAAVAAIVFVVTLWPTFFMGMSLPLVSKILSTDASRPARWIPLLYGWNTLGAACGSFAAILLLFRTVDFSSGLRLGAVVSASCAVWAIALLPRLVRDADEAESAAPPPAPSTLPDEHRATIGFNGWLFIYALSGFIALSLEIVWFRVIGVVLKSSAFTFGYLLGVFLAGVGLGSILANQRWALAWAPTRAFFLLQTAVPMVATFSVAAFVAVVGKVPALEPVWAYMSSYEPMARFSDRLGTAIALHALAIALIFPATLMMGLSFGFLQRAVQHDLAALGRRVGWLQTANIVGSMLGALLTGLVLLHWLGSPGTLRLLAVLGAVFLGLHFWSSRARRLTWGPVAAVTLGLAVAASLPGSRTFWARLHHAPAAEVIHGEDGSGLALLKVRNNAKDVVVLANGLGQSGLPFGGIHTVLGALPAFLHPDPKRIAVIGLGSGDTVFAAAGRTATQRVDSIEIIAPELDVLVELDQRRAHPGLTRLLADPRVEHHLTDGRTFIRKQEAYDIIEADALRPSSAYSGNLYSVEYFSLVRSRLKPGGFGVSWVPTDRVRASMVAAFPYVVFLKTIAIGSASPITFDREAVLRRIRDAAAQEYYASAGIDLEQLLAGYLTGNPQRYGPDYDRSRLTEVNQDLFPRDEFGVPLRNPALHRQP